MRLRFVLGQVARGLVKNKAMTLAVVLVTFVSLLFVGTGALTQMQVAQMKNQWYSKVEVTVSMCAPSDTDLNCKEKEATKDQIDAVMTKLKTGELAGYVADVYFQDKAAVFADFQKQLGDTALGKAATVEMMPVNFRVKLKNPEEYEVIDRGLRGQPGVQSVQDQRRLLEPLFQALNKATLLSWLLAAVMVVAAVLLIVTTIRLSALSRAKETGIMRLVGASNFFIHLPFMLEGAIATLIGAALAVGGLAAGVKYIAQGWLSSSFRWVHFVDMSDVAIVAPLLIIAALVLAAFASALSLAKYTKI